MVTESTLAAGEDYASIADILAADDLPHKTLTVWGWKANGAPLKIRVRGLSLVEREDVRATAWTKTGTRDSVALIVGYLRYGVVVPGFNEEQARQLVHKHAGTVEQISDFIHALTELDYAQTEAIANESADSDNTGGSSAEDEGAASADDRPLARSARRAA